MRIIDSNKDFYDYYQNICPDNTFTFDRRDSYVLTKEDFASNFSTYSKPLIRSHYYSTADSRNRFLLLQICHTYWLFLLTITDATDCGTCLDYSLKLISMFKNYNTKRELIKLSQIDFRKLGFMCEYHTEEEIYDAKRIKSFEDAIGTNNYNELQAFNRFTLYRDMAMEEKHIPILKNLGIASEVDAKDIYFSLDEYFSLEKTESERTEAIGTTNNDKIESHGFDLKTSFRGKNKK